MVISSYSKMKFIYPLSLVPKFIGRKLNASIKILDSLVDQDEH